MSLHQDTTRAPEVTAQDVIDALRFALMAQKDDAEIVKLMKALLDLAPETTSDGGVKLIFDLISEASLKVGMV